MLRPLPSGISLYASSIHTFFTITSPLICPLLPLPSLARPFNASKLRFSSRHPVPYEVVPHSDGENAAFGRRFQDRPRSGQYTRCRRVFGCFRVSRFQRSPRGTQMKIIRYAPRIRKHIKVAGVACCAPRHERVDDPFSKCAEALRGSILPAKSWRRQRFAFQIGESIIWTTQGQNMLVG